MLCEAPWSNFKLIRRYINLLNLFIYLFSFCETPCSSLLQVEYCPCVVATECWPLMKEFMLPLVDTVADVPSVHFKSKMDAIYMPADTCMQYLEHFNNFRKAAAQLPIR